MSKKILFGALDTIELLLFLSSLEDSFITSSRIRKRFPEIARNTLDKKLNKLVEQRFVRRRKQIRDKPGADRMKYKLTQEGRDMIDELIKANIRILRPILDSQLESTLLKSGQKEEVIDGILKEFAKHNEEKERE